MQHPHDPAAGGDNVRLRAIALICAATVCFSFLDTTAKYLVSTGAPVSQVIWLRFVSHALLTAAVLGRKAVASAFTTVKPGQHVLRGIFMLGATAFNFMALQYIQLDQGAAIFFLSPFLVAALAGPLLGEWIGWRRLAAICTGFIGVLFVVRPGFGGVHWAVSFSFAATLSYALYSLWTRLLSRFDPPETTQVLTPLTGIVVMAPLAILYWQTPDSVATALLLASLGLSGGLGHWLLILAHQRAPAPILAPFGYINIVFMIAFGFAVFGDIPSWWTLAGAGIIIASGFYLLLRERQSPSAPASVSTVAEG